MTKGCVEPTLRVAGAIVARRTIPPADRPRCCSTVMHHKIFDARHDPIPPELHRETSRIERHSTLSGDGCLLVELCWSPNDDPGGIRTARAKSKISHQQWRADSKCSQLGLDYKLVVYALKLGVWADRKSTILRAWAAPRNGRIPVSPNPLF